MGSDMVTNSPSSSHWPWRGGGRRYIPSAAEEERWVLECTKLLSWACYDGSIVTDPETMEHSAQTLKICVITNSRRMVSYCAYFQERLRQLAK